MKQVLLAILGSFLFVSNLSVSPVIAQTPFAERVDFWKRIYSQYSENEVVFFNANNLSEIVYTAALPMGLDRETKRQLLSEIAKDVSRSLELLADPKMLHAEALRGITRRVYINTYDMNLEKIKLRYQTGLRERFMEGYELSGIYDDEIKDKLEAEGMPEALMAIAFVESLFYVPARSRMGAAGLWQFLRGTAKEFMHVNYLVDERFDPMVATDAAIDYLKDAYGRFNSWPLAITSYNYGRWGMQKAIDKMGTSDLETIIAEYEHPRFGFAAQNYYAEVLAALEVYRNAETLFHESTPLPDWEYEWVAVPHAVYLKDLAKVGAVNKSWLLKHNPALTTRVRQSRESIPPQFQMRIPKGTKQTFLKKLKHISKRDKYRAMRHIRAKHRANGREDVRAIATKYDIDYSKLAKRLGRPVTFKPKKGTVIILRSADSHFSRGSEI